MLADDGKAKRNELANTQNKQAHKNIIRKTVGIPKQNRFLSVKL